jgi:predicted transcriptional regulator
MPRTNTDPTRIVRREGNVRTLHTAPAMPRRAPKNLDVRGDLQSEVMAVLWRLGEGTVDDVRNSQPARRRAAYTTIQTVMTRLYERGLLDRKRRGPAFVYRPKMDEASYVAKSIARRLADASPEARREALVSLVGDLDQGDLDEVARYANRIRRARGR